MINLSGATPLNAWLLQANPLSAAWLAGGKQQYSENAAVYNLQHFDKQSIESAWIIAASEGKFRLSEKVLTELELDLARDCDLVGEFQTGFREEKQLLWKRKEVSKGTEK